MSEFITNKSCDMCRKIEVGLTEMKIGPSKHHLCYNCISTLALDIIEFASHNLRNEIEAKGYTITKTNEQGYIIEKNK